MAAELLPPGLAVVRNVPQPPVLLVYWGRDRWGCSGQGGRSSALKGHQDGESVSQDGGASQVKDLLSHHDPKPFGLSVPNTQDWGEKRCVPRRAPWHFPLFRQIKLTTTVAMTTN